MCHPHMRRQSLFTLQILGLHFTCIQFVEHTSQRISEANLDVQLQTAADLSNRYIKEIVGTELIHPFYFCVLLFNRLL